jgi:hypothetical protein
MPTRKVAVTRSNDWLTIQHRKLIQREGEAKVGLGEGGDNGTEERGKVIGIPRRNTNRKKSCFVEIDREPSGKLKVI